MSVLMSLWPSCRPMAEQLNKLWQVFLATYCTREGLEGINQLPKLGSHCVRAEIRSKPCETSCW